jgi:ABC-2 type transport system permease protein
LRALSARLASGFSARNLTKKSKEHRFRVEAMVVRNELVDALMAQTPPEFRYLVDDRFNRIVLYDNKAISAVSQKTSDGKYRVTSDVQARKVQADGNGVESPMPLADYIDIGVFSGKKDEEKPLYMRKEKLTREHQTFTIVVDQQPTRAGIDPYNKLIDRIADDNMIDITKQ